MDQSNENLYRKALYAAFGVFVVLMCLATSARAETILAEHATNQIERGAM